MGRNKSKGPTKKNALILMTFILLVLSAFSPKLPLGILLCSVNWLDDLNLYLFHCPRLGCFSDLSAAAWRTLLVFSSNLILTLFMIIFWIDYLKRGLQSQNQHNLTFFESSKLTVSLSYKIWARVIENIKHLHWHVWRTKNIWYDSLEAIPWTECNACSQQWMTWTRPIVKIVHD